MSLIFRKFIAVLMLLWLPLSSGSALAAIVSMELHRDACQEMLAQEMHHADTGHYQHTETIAAQDRTAAHEQTDFSCDACGVCHLACSSYLTNQDAAGATAQMPEKPATPYLVASNSVTSTPLIHPPLVSA